MILSQAIQDAVRGGYKSPYDWMENQIFVRHRGMGRNTEIEVFSRYVLLDPLFWQALGKSRGWLQDADEKIDQTGHYYGYKIYARRFFDHILNGKDITSFFEELV